MAVKIAISADADSWRSVLWRATVPAMINLIRLDMVTGFHNHRAYSPFDDVEVNQSAGTDLRTLRFAPAKRAPQRRAISSCS